MALMTIREYGRLRGVTHHSVRKAIDTGKLKNSLVASEKGKRKTVLIDSDAADREWPKGDQELVKNMVADVPHPETEELEDDETDPEKNKIKESFQSSRAIREDYQARLAKLEFEREEGKLVSFEETERAWVQRATEARTRLVSIPSKMKQRFPNFPEEHRLGLEDLIRESLEDLAGSRGSDEREG